VRFRTNRLREEFAGSRPAGTTEHQLTLLGQFTAGFMHEFNNPWQIVAGRLEVLLDERKEDASLCADLEQMLKETRYMGNIAGPRPAMQSSHLPMILERRSIDLAEPLTVQSLQESPAMFPM